MIQTKIIKDLNGKNDLIETSTTLPESKKLLQIETNIIYKDCAIDSIESYNADGSPRVKYSYKEIGKT